MSLNVNITPKQGGIYLVSISGSIEETDTYLFKIQQNEIEKRGK